MSDHSVVDYRALMTEALLELERMQAKLDALQRVEPEPIAIIGMGCRFPGGVIVLRLSGRCCGMG